jgi:hypothetical protein
LLSQVSLRDQTTWFPKISYMKEVRFNYWNQALIKLDTYIGAFVLHCVVQFKYFLRRGELSLLQDLMRCSLLHTEGTYAEDAAVLDLAVSDNVSFS